MASKRINIWIRTGPLQYCKIMKLIPVMLARAFGPSGLTKMVIIRLIIYIYLFRFILSNLSPLQRLALNLNYCDKHCMQKFR